MFVKSFPLAPESRINEKGMYIYLSGEGLSSIRLIHAEVA